MSVVLINYFLFSLVTILRLRSHKIKFYCYKDIDFQLAFNADGNNALVDTNAVWFKAITAKFSFALDNR